MSNKKCPECNGPLGTGDAPGHSCVHCQHLARVKCQSVQVVSKEKYDGLRQQLARANEKVEPPVDTVVGTTGEGESDGKE